MSDDYNPLTDPKPTEAKNIKAYASPSPGDYWNEMFVPYFVVLEVREDLTLIVCDKTKEVDSSHWTWDLSQAKHVHRDYLKRVRYGSIDGFVADVFHSHQWAVEAWKELGSPYVPILDPTRAPVEVDFRTLMEYGL